MAPSSLAKVFLNVTAQVCSNLQNSFINEMNLGTIHLQQHTGLRVTSKSTLILHVMNKTFPSHYIECDVSINPKSYTNIVDLNLHLGKNKLFESDALQSSLLCNIIK